MPSVEQLQFAQRFPFSSTAKNIVKELNLKPEEVDEAVLKRASIMVSKAASGKKYVLDVKNTDLLENEITAFPIAKILVSLMKDSSLYKSFASMVSKSAFYYLENSGDRKQLALDLANELSIKFELSDKKPFFVAIPLQQFLSIRFRDKELKLVNQQLEGGKVLLNINLFCRFIAEKIFSQVFQSLPVQTASLPKSFKHFASQLSSQLKKQRFEEFNFKVGGRVDPNAFPPCIASLYKQQLAGKSLPHMARFFLASFLNAVGMAQKEMLEVFKKSPNFDEKIASYQIKRIVEQGYAPASCEKIKSYGLCEDNCNVKHPLRYYRRKMRESRQKKAKEINSGKP